MFAKHYNALLNFLNKKLPSIEIASDIAQETFAKVLAAEQNTTIENPRAFLFRTARNLCADYYRNKNTQFQNEMMNINEVECSAPPEVCPDLLFDKDEKLSRLSSAVAELPVRCREVFILHKLEGYSHAEIAERFGISRNAVEKHIIKAMLYLRKQLNDKETSRL